MKLNYQLVDIDNHYYEPDDCFTRHIEPEFADHAVHIRKGPNGLGQPYIGDKRLGSQSVTQTDHIGAPGSLRAYFAGMEDKPVAVAEEDRGGLGDMRDVVRPKEIPEFIGGDTGREDRLVRMDEQNLDAVLMLPTLACCVEYELNDHPAAAAANIRSFNKWLEEDWGYSFKNRILAAPLISLLDVDGAVAELERVLALGARTVVLRIGPVAGRSPADPVFDPFWARLVEAGIPLSLHLNGDCGFCELYSSHWGEQPRPPVHKHTAFQVYTSFMERPVSDTLAALILHNLFARFPTLKVMSIENGAGWVRPLLRGMDKAWRSARGRSGIGGEVIERPSDVFKRNVYVSPFPEDDIAGLIETIGADRVLFGSDYPHPEGLADPAGFADELVGQSESDIRLIMRDTNAALLGL